MLTLGFGLIAALAWGIHDICVRFVGARVGILPALATVLIAGSTLVAPISFVAGDWFTMGWPSIQASVASGLAYTIGCIGLYNAFSIGPVRLVAPIMGAYPVLSIGWSAINGTPVSALQWLALGMVIGGVALVAILSNDEETQHRRRAAIAYSLMGGVGFATAFAFGQHATLSGSELPVILIARLTASVCVLAIALATRASFGGIRPFILILLTMGALDALALGIVIAAGQLPNPEYAAVSASIFGLITVILARLFLREHMSPGQWGGVLITFAGIGYLAW